MENANYPRMANGLETERINAYSRVNEATGAINPLSEIT